MSDKIRRHKRNDGLTPPDILPGRENARVHQFEHGLFATQTTMRHEDKEDFQRMRSALLTDYEPANYVELMMAEEVVRCHWRLLRAHSLETALMDNRLCATARVMKVDGNDPKYNYLNWDEGVGAALEAVDQKRFAMFLDYIARAERSYYKAVQQIERTQAERRKKELHEVKMEEHHLRKWPDRAAVGSFGRKYPEPTFVEEPPEAA